MIQITCNICNTKQDVKPVKKITKDFYVLKCNNCKVVSIYPIPPKEVLIDHYTNYYLTRVNNYREELLVDLHLPIYNKLISFFYKHKCKILDFGFGNGAFLKLVAKNGGFAHGIEMSKQNCIQLKEYSMKNNLKIDIYFSENLLLNIPQKFDIITLFQVIEHLRYPSEIIKFLSKLQNPGGILYIECPNNDSLYIKLKSIFFSLLGEKFIYKSLKFPEHLYGFNIDSMSNLLKQSGYSIIEIRDYHLSDMVHQVESIFWWPPLIKNGNKKSWKSIIWFVDFVFFKFLRSGSGLYAIAKKL